MMTEASFTRKKIQSLTLGEKLRKLRGEMHVPLTEVARSTRIRVRYLELLEEGEYEKLPADVYVRGFLRNYARFLGVDESALLKLYERERNIQSNLGNVKEVKTSSFNLPATGVVITARMLTFGVAVLLLGGVCVYLYQEFSRFAAEPELVILEPAAGFVSENTEVILRGKTEKGARVSVNGEASFVGSEGEFSEKLTLQPGINTVTVVAINRFEKSKTETLALEARFPEQTGPTSEELKERAMEDENFSLEIKTGEGVTLTIVADGVVVQNGPLDPGVIKKVEAKNEIRITSSNGKETSVKTEDGQESALGQDEKPVKEALFQENGRQEKGEGVQ
jgi:transcriptional regulator with XRE-family HTH domain